MNKKFLQMMLVLLVCGISFTSCKKDKETEEEKKEEEIKKAPDPDYVTPGKSDATGICVAIQTVSYQDMPMIGITEIVIGVGVAAFPEAAGSSTLRDGGNVSLEQTALEKQTNNSYVNKIDASNSTGIQFSGDVDWMVSGANGVPAIDTSVSDVFPSFIQIKTAANTTVSLSGAYKLETQNVITDADSVIYSVYGPESSISVTKAGGTGSHEFTADEMSKLGKGMGFVQVAAYKFVGEKASGAEKIYFVNQKVNTVSVKFE